MSAAYEEPEYGAEIDWTALDDPVQAGRVLRAMEEVLDSDLRAAIETENALEIGEEGCSTLARIFDLLMSSDEERRLDGLGYLVRQLRREQRLVLEDIADNLATLTRGLRRDAAVEISDPEFVITRYAAAFDRLAARVREAAKP